MAKPGQKLIMRACTRCGGAAYLEDPRDDDWRCLQCGRAIPVSGLAAQRRAMTPAA